MTKVGTEKEMCYRCNAHMVYATHTLGDDKWQIKCNHCGFHTSFHDTWEKARKEWDMLNTLKKCLNCEFKDVMRDSDGYIIGTDCKLEKCKYE